MRQHYNQQADDLANLIGLLEKKSAQSSEYERQVGGKSAELSLYSGDLRKRAEELSSLQRENDRKSVELNDINKAGNSSVD